MEKSMTNDIACAGRVISMEKAYNYQNKKSGRTEVFWRLMLEVPRLSENYDTIPFILPEKLLVHQEVKEGSLVLLKGTLRSRDFVDNDGSRHTSVYGYADEIRTLTKAEYEEMPEKNRVHLDSVLCRNANYRATGSGRLIADLLLANNRIISQLNPANQSRQKRKSYYIPSIAWGSMAKAAKNLKAGDAISLVGRFQSRKYRRKTDLPTEDRTTYEVSILDYNNIKKEA